MKKISKLLLVSLLGLTVVSCQDNKPSNDVGELNNVTSSEGTSSEESSSQNSENTSSGPVSSETTTSEIALGKIEGDEVVDEYGLVTNPVVGKEYYFGVEQLTLDQMLFFSSSLSGKYFNSTDDYSLSPKVKLESVAGGFRIAFEVEGQKQYLNASRSGNQFKAVISNDPNTLWTYDTQYNIFVCEIDGNKGFVGSKDEHETFAVYAYKSNKSKIDKTIYPARFFDVETTEKLNTPFDPNSIEKDDVVLTEEEKVNKIAGQKITLSEVGDMNQVVYTPSTGKQKLLVVPVMFSDVSLEDLQKASYEYNWDVDYSSKEKVKSNIEKTFFGESNETGWESVKSYMNKSSYGKLELSGTVTDFYQSSYTLKDYLALTGSGDLKDYYQPSWTMVDDVAKWVMDNHPEYKDEYDQNKDGFIDGIWMVYMAPNSGKDMNQDSGEYKWYKSYLGKSYNNYVDYTDEENPVDKVNNEMWAYVYWNYNNYSKEEQGTPYVYGWAGYDFSAEGYGKDVLDAHTFIHETGHMLGLEDYYDYSQESSPLGSVDMHDANIGDDNAYSKYLLDWVSPEVKWEKGTYTLKPFESSGNCFLLPRSTFGDSPFDEYILLEFYTPTGLNEKDSTETGYPGNGIKTFTKEGVKVLHVDSRLAKVDVAKEKVVAFTNQFYDDENYYTILAHSNTVAYNAVEGDESRLLTLVSSKHTGENYYYPITFTATDEDLFHKDDVLPSTFKFNDGTELGYTVTIGERTSEGITITIS